MLLAQGDVAAGRARLLEVLAQAQSEGYQRLFLDEGALLLDLLRALVADARPGALRAYLRRMLVAVQLHDAHAPDASAGAGLLEPLSPQEQRVLQLLARGLSNGEIAQALVVSPNTVKTHLRNIYRKLDVTTRRAAREAARQLGLL
jgi:LuxR family maltose regulon positive regulatory protein